MTRGDIIGLIASYAYAFGMLVIVEAVGRAFKWPQYLTRKIIHIGAGMWTWAILALFDHWYFGIIPFATFIVMNTIFYRRQVFAQMDSEESSPGTVYFAFSITVLFALLWRTGGTLDRVPIAMAGVMAMTWGDAMANIIGRSLGKNTYTFFGHQRSWEGTAAMLVFSFAAIFLTLWLLPGSALSLNSMVIGPLRAAIMALFAVMVGAFAEGVSPAGLDNLSVPLLTGGAIYLLYLL
ncbi:MAG: phosphatidate cytidylyltransferase [Anaerolineae bacterium]